MAAAITVVCPHCNNRMQASAVYVGRQGRCPVCKNLVEIRPASDQDALASLYPQSKTAIRRSARGLHGTTDAPGWLAGILGALSTALLYLAVFMPLKDHYLSKLFVARGIIPYITVLVTFWGLALLVLKSVAVRRQLGFAELELELIPLDIGVQITPDNVQQFLNHLSQQSAVQRGSIVGRRIQGALEHFKSRNSVPEVQQYLSTLAEIEASRVDSGYTLLRAFIWTVPILGFIGTVMGIGQAVGGLDITLSGGAGGDALMQGMKIVTAGLAVAFDTTLVALCLAILLLFPTESLRKTEYAMLDRIEAFANESLLRRLSDQVKRPTPEEMPGIVRDALETAFREHQRWLAQWQAQVAALGESVGKDFERAVVEVQDRLSVSETERLEKMHELSRLLGELFTQASRISLDRLETEQSHSQQFSGFLDVALELQKTLTEHVRSSRELLSLDRPDGPSNDGSLATRLSELERQLGILKGKIGTQLAAPKDPTSSESSGPGLKLADPDATLIVPERQPIFGKPPFEKR